MAIGIDKLRLQYKKDGDYSRFLRGWCDQNQGFIRSVATKSREELLRLLIEATMLTEFIGLTERKGRKLHEIQEDYLALVELKGKVLLKDAQSTLDKERATIEKNLTGGRLESVRNRKHKANRNRLILKKAIEDLFLNGGGWKMKNSEITEFLLKRNLTDRVYQKSTLLGIVKSLASQIRKAEKQKSGLTNS